MVFFSETTLFFSMHFFGEDSHSKNFGWIHSEDPSNFLLHASEESPRESHNLKKRDKPPTVQEEILDYMVSWKKTSEEWISRQKSFANLAS